jgi:hypothetical protein
VTGQPPEIDALADLTDDEMSEVDRFMGEHMYRHQISNNVNGMSCDSWCRTKALGEAFRRHVLLPRREARTALQPD